MKRKIIILIAIATAVFAAAAFAIMKQNTIRASEPRERSQEAAFELVEKLPFTTDDVFGALVILDSAAASLE